MAGKIKQLITLIIEQRAKGNPILVNTTKTKLILKGIDPALYTPQSEDDPVVMGKLLDLARELGLQIDGFQAKTSTAPARDSHAGRS